MIYNTENPYEAEKCDKRYMQLRTKRAVIDMKEKRPRRSLNQNNYLHLIIGYFALEYGCSASEVKVKYYKEACNGDIFKVKRMNRRGQMVPYLRSSADLKTDEMSLSIERFRNWASAEVGIYLPAPHEADFLLYIEQELERAKEWIEQPNEDNEEEQG